MVLEVCPHSSITAIRKRLCLTSGVAFTRTTQSPRGERLEHRYDRHHNLFVFKSNLVTVADIEFALQDGEYTQAHFWS